MAYTKYSLTPANNNAAPPDGAPEGMLPSAVNDTMRDMMAQIRDVGDGIRDGTYTMTAPKITGGSITGAAFTGNTFTNPVISGGSINNASIGATIASTGAFTTLSASSTVSGAGFSTYLASPPAIGGTAAASGKFTTLEATGVTTVQAGNVSAPAITTSGDTNTGIYFPAADTIAFTEGGAEAMRLDSSGNLRFNSGYGSVATAYGCRAWVNFNGTGTPSIRASGNVSSLTDNQSGDFTINFTNALPDANYAMTASANVQNQGAPGAIEGHIVNQYSLTTMTSSAIRILVGVPGTAGSSGVTRVDLEYNFVAIFR